MTNEDARTLSDAVDRSHMQYDYEQTIDSVRRVTESLAHAREQRKLLAIPVDLEDADRLATAAAAYVFVQQARDAKKQVTRIQAAAHAAQWRRRLAWVAAGSMTGVAVMAVAWWVAMRWR